MEPFSPETFGQLNADDYDEWQDPGTTEQSVALICELAGGGRVLELAIGTGRLALPLAEAGLDISGIDASPEMIAKLRQKPGGPALEVMLGDFAEVGVEGRFDHVFLAFNTLFNLQTQDEQLRCFRNVAARLAPDGSFLIDAFVPDFAAFTENQSVKTRHVGRDMAMIEAVQHDRAAQILEFQRMWFASGGTRLVPLRMRYAWPSEIDLMARLAGLELSDRWGGWQKQPFDMASRMHVSVYRKPAHDAEVT